MSQIKMVDERLKLVETLVTVLTEKLDKLEERLIETTAQKEDLASQIVSVKISSQEAIKTLQETVEGLKGEVATYEMLLKERKEEWPTPRESTPTQADSIPGKSIGSESTSDGFQDVRSRRSKRKSKGTPAVKISFAEKHRLRSGETVVVVGDSLVRGVGKELERDSHMFTTHSIGGARIETITKELDKFKDNDERHLIVLVGTNNIQNEGSEVLLDKYCELIKKCKTIKNRELTLVGIPKRFDLNRIQESRRVSVNNTLRDLCIANQVEFLGHEPPRDRLGWDGLHLNALGNDELASKIFAHCKYFLD